MKKILFVAVLVTFGLGKVNAQNANFSAVAGFHNLTIKASGGGATVSADGNGFFVGIASQFYLSENLNLNPEMHFATSSNEGESVEQIIFPVMLKFSVSERFSLLAGPQLDIVISDSDGLNAMGLGLGFGASFDFSDRFFVSSRYALGLSNRLEDAPSGLTVKMNTFQAGIGFRF